VHLPFVSKELWLLVIGIIAVLRTHLCSLEHPTTLQHPAITGAAALGQVGDAVCRLSSANHTVIYRHRPQQRMLKFIASSSSSSGRQ